MREDGRHAVLIIDDADALASRETLAELCSLVKLEYEERRMLTLVLVGSQVLDGALRQHPELAHHVEIRVEMQPLPSNEAAAYLGHRLSVASGDPQILLPGAAAALHELAEGAPGRMNVLADNALFEAYRAGRDQVARSDVERAFADLGWAAGASTGAESPAPRAQGGRRGRSAAKKAIAETTTPDAGGSLGDLDSELEAVFTPQAGAEGKDPQTKLMDFDAGNSGRSASPLPARAVAAPTEIQLEPSDVIERSGPPKEDEVDDLFMELIED